MKNNKKTITIVAVICLLLALLAGIFFLGKGKDVNNDNDDVQQDGTEQTDNDLDNDFQESGDLVTDDVVTKLVVTPDMIMENAMFVKNNDMEQPGELKKVSSGAELKIEGGYNGLKCLFVRGIDLPTADVDTMSVRIRSLGSNGITRIRLYLCSTPSEKMDANKVIDTVKGDDAIYADLVTMTEPDAKGWQTVTIKVSELPYWAHTTNIKGFNFAFLSKDDVQEIKEIQFTQGGVKYKDAQYQYTTGKLPANVLATNAKAVKNNNLSNLGTVKLADEGAQFTMTNAGGAVYNGLKSIYVNNIALNPKAYDTMTVRIRSLGSGGFTRFRLYLNSAANEKMDLNKLIDTGADSPLKANLLSITEPDAQGWQTVTIKVGELKYWKDAKVITGFNFGYLSKDATQEVKEIVFSKGAISYAPSAKPETNVQFTSGNFPAGTLYDDAHAIMNNNLEAKGTGELVDTGVKYTMTREDGTSYNGLKSVYVDKIALDTTAYDTMTIRMRSLGTNGITRYRLYLNASEHDKPDTNKLLDTGGNPALNDNLLTVSEPDANGWQVVTINVAGLDFWKNNPVVTAFNFGWVSTDDVQEISQIIFSKGTPELDIPTEEPGEQPGEGDEPSIEYTSGNFTKDILNSDAVAILNNNVSVTRPGELLDTGVKYTMLSEQGTVFNGLKSIFVDNIALDTSAYDTMTIRMRSLGEKGITRYRLYLNTVEGAKPDANKLLDTAGDKINSDLLTVTEPDTNGWQVVTINVAGLDYWKNNEVIKAFNFGWLSQDDAQEISQIIFSKGTPELDIVPEEVETNPDAEVLVENGLLPADVLCEVGTPIYNNNAADTTPTEALNATKDSVTYTFPESLAEKSVVVSKLSWKPADFTKMTVRVKADTPFERFRLYLNDGLYADPVVDVRVDGTDIIGSSNVNGSVVSITKDSDNWYTVVLSVKDLEAWTSASTITDFRFSYQNEGANQQIGGIVFTKASGSFSPSALYIFGTPLHNNDLTRTEITETLVKTEEVVTGVKHGFDSSYAAGALKSIFVEDLELDPTQYNTMTVKLRSVNGSAFTRYRLYLLSAATDTHSKNLVIDTANTNKDLLAASEPDADGWVTVTMQVGELDYWKNAAMITGFNFGYLNADANIEFGEVAFSMVTVEEPTPEPEPEPENTTYVMSLDVLNEIGIPNWGRNANGKNYGAVTAVSEADGYAYSFATLDGVDKNSATINNPSLRGLYLDCKELDVSLQEFDTMEFKIKAATATKFDHFRFYFGKDSSSLALKVATYDDLTKGNITVSAPDENGWMTVTINLSGISGWSDATSIDDIYLGYVPNPKGNTQAISAITFTKSVATE